MANFKIELSEQDLADLIWFAHLPTWIQDEWNQKYSECNCGPLPCETLKRLLRQADPQGTARIPLKDRDGNTVVFQDLHGNYHEIEDADDEVQNR